MQYTPPTGPNRKSAGAVSLKVVALTVLFATNSISFSQELVPSEVIATLKQSADWQIANVTESNLNGWIIAPFYDGLLRTADTTGDASYLAEVLKFANAAHWAPGSRTYHADDHAVGHAWMDVYLIDPTATYRMTRTANRLDKVIADPITEALEFGKAVTTPGVSVTDRWTWCDALYMAPPTLARLHAATGDTTYLEFMYQEFQYTYNLLYDSAEGFFYRDSRYIDDRTANGKKVFWSRGNGWVYGGLALILDYLPSDHKDRPFYEGLFQEMTIAVIAAQQSDGLWRPSLADPDQIPVGETSGSGFFTFGLAWGINNGLLDRTTTWPIVEAGWRGLLTRLGNNGLVGYVQQPGAAPAAFTASSTREYGTGAFLLAGSEVLKGIGGAASVDASTLLIEAEFILSPLIDGTPLGDGWFFSEWFGLHYTNNAPWIYHAQHGFVYRDPSSTNQNMFIYDDAMDAWWWTNEEVYPFIYAYNPVADNVGTDIDSAWLFYFEDSSVPRVFGVVDGVNAGEALFFGP